MTLDRATQLLIFGAVLYTIYVLWCIKRSLRTGEKDYQSTMTAIRKLGHNEP